MRWEVVPIETERADPALGGEVDTREGVKERGAGRLAVQAPWQLPWG